MNSPARSPILYGVPFSQPVRAVIWLMLHKRLPFEFVPISPGAKSEGGSRNEAFLAKNPGGTIPPLVAPDRGFVLAESNAILCYLCNRCSLNTTDATAHKTGVDSVCAWMW